MGHIIYSSAVDMNIRGDLDFDDDSFKVMLTNALYFPSKTSHTNRGNVTPYEIGDTGTYVAGGSSIALTLTTVLAANKVSISFQNIAWTNVTAAVRWAVVYKTLGGLAVDDPLIMALDFGQTMNLIGGTVALTFTAPLDIVNAF